MSGINFGRRPRGSEGRVSTVTANVWTPDHDGSGNITSASWSDLPLQQWCKVSGTKLSQLDAQLTTAGLPVMSTLDKGNSNSWAGIFAAWTGGALAGTSWYHPSGGGHFDWSVNALIELQIEKMGGDAGWNLRAAPSDPADATYPWSSDYINRTGGFTSYTNYLPDTIADGLANDILPDGLPTSRHTYRGVWYDSTRNQIGMGRISRWVFDLDTDTWTRQRWQYSSSNVGPTINQVLYYHAATDELIGYFARAGDSDYYSFGYSAASGRSIVDITAPTRWFGQGATGCRISSTEVLWIWWTPDFSQERWAIQNLSTRAITSEGTITNGFNLSGTGQELQVCLYNPTTGKVIRRLTDTGTWKGKWYEFDLSTKANGTEVTPAGEVPPMTDWPGGNYFDYAARNCFVAVAPTADSADAVYVLRYA